MGETQSQTRPSAVGVIASLGLSALVIGSLGFAALSLDLGGYRFELRAGPLAAATLAFALLSLFETLRLSALAQFDQTPGLAGWGINAAAMALVQAPFGLVGAEAYRANAYVRRGEALSAILAASLVARALGMLCMLVLIALAAGLLTESVPGWVRSMSAVAALLGFAAIFVGPFALRRGRLRQRSSRWASFIQALAGLSAAQLIWAAVWSFIVVLLRAVALWACAAGLGTPVSLAFAVFASAAGLVLLLIPFVSGIVGVREGGIAGVLVLAGLPLAAGILVGFALRVGAVLGGLLSMAVSHFLVRETRP